MSVDFRPDPNESFGMSCTQARLSFTVILPALPCALPLALLRLGAAPQQISAAGSPVSSITGSPSRLSRCLDRLDRLDRCRVARELPAQPGLPPREQALVYPGLPPPEPVLLETSALLRRLSPGRLLRAPPALLRLPPPGRLLRGLLHCLDFLRLGGFSAPPALPRFPPPGRLLRAPPALP